LRKRWGWRSSTCTFERAGEATLVAVRSPRAWEEYEIHQAGESLGSVWVDQTIFPAALHLTFTEQTPDRSPRSRLVALVAFTSLLSRVRQRSARVPR
ncbi:MAG: hypothetical protein L3J91_02120, partial [Thermoplasmata archaeon]|nr:hypothetical protein [Thermoplasmata archaeon]